MTMAFENTITENDLSHDFEPDLVVDGLSESILSRLMGLFGMGRS
jgi:hypothetical protein